MAPSRARAVVEESKPDVSNGKDRLAPSAASSSKFRKNGATASANAVSSKDTALSNTIGVGIANGNAIQGGAAGIDWSSDEVSLLNTLRTSNLQDKSLLNAYRTAYRLETPTAFRSPLNDAILSIPGIGRYSPTMARKVAKRKTAKDQLALTVRKHFNGLAVNETDVVVDFLYKVKNQDKSFKMRFAPPKQR